jgi:hypothetical protein
MKIDVYIYLIFHKNLKSHLEEHIDTRNELEIFYFLQSLFFYNFFHYFYKNISKFL